MKWFIFEVFLAIWLGGAMLVRVTYLWPHVDTHSFFAVLLIELIKIVHALLWPLELLTYGFDGKLIHDLQSFRI